MERKFRFALKVELHQEDENWYWEVRTQNGELLSSSQRKFPITSKDECRKELKYFASEILSQLDQEI